MFLSERLLLVGQCVHHVKSLIGSLRHTEDQFECPVVLRHANDDCYCMVTAITEHGRIPPRGHRNRSQHHLQGPEEQTREEELSKILAREVMDK